MAIDILKKINILYVEDDDNIRKELENLLSKLFKNVYTANNGLNGLKEFKKYENEIDIIVSDINMPELNGIEMVKAIRLKNPDMPIVLTTAYSDKDFLTDAIKIKVDAYIIKPIDVKVLIESLQKIAQHVYNNTLLKQQKLELSNYKEALDSNNIIIKANIDFEISFVNKLFEITTSFTNEELKSKSFLSLKHSDITSEVFELIQKSMNLDISWNGIIKYITKDENTFFIAETYIMPTHDEYGKTNGYLCILSDITEEQSKKRNIQMAMMKDKGDIFSKSKSDNAESFVKVNELSSKVETFENEISEYKKRHEKSANLILDLKTEKKVLSKDLSYYKKIVDSSEHSTSMAAKANKDNADLKSVLKETEVELKELYISSSETLEDQKNKYEKKLKRLTTEVKIFRENIGNVDLNNEKIIYWKEKAKSEAMRVAAIEKKIIETKDESFLKRIFN